VKIIIKGKKCTKCGKVKPLALFHKCKKSADGRTYWCKRCTANWGVKYRSKERVHRSKERVQKYQKAYQKAYREKNKLGGGALQQ